MNDEQKREALKDFQKLPGFTSKKEIASSQLASKTSAVCDCAIDDEFITSIVDENNMLDIGEWTVKLDACDPEKKTYAFYKPLYTSNEVEIRINAMIDCNFDVSLGFFTYTFDQDVLEEIEIYTDSINGDPINERCRDVVCSDRHDAQDPITGWFDGIMLSDNGFSQQLRTPFIEIVYEKGWLATGRTNVYMRSYDAYPSSNNNFGAYEFQFELSYYYKRCGSTVTRSAGTITGSINSGNPDQTFNEYSSKRLRAGSGNVKVRAKLNNPNLFFTSPWIEILF